MTGTCIPAGDYAETKQKVIKLPDDVSGEALELLMQGMHAQEVCSQQMVRTQYAALHGHGTSAVEYMLHCVLTVIPFINDTDWFMNTLWHAA